MIYVSITGKKSDWQEKLKEINELKLTEVAVFLERFKKRDNLYKFLSKSCIKKVPLVHIREDVTKEEIQFFIDNYGTQHFNIHEEHFDILDRWDGYQDKLYLEMNYDSKISKNVRVKEIGGFCIDLSHFKSALARGLKEAHYTFSRKNKIKFGCNHLNGYDPDEMCDMHTVKDLKDFDYLTTLPKYVFSEIIALEVDNSIKEQLKFKEYIDKLLV